MGREYYIDKSKEVFQLFKAICFSKTGLYYSELQTFSKKSKGNLSAQLKPLKENNLVERIWDKEKKDYLFKVNFETLEDKIRDCFNAVKQKEINEHNLRLHLNILKLRPTADKDLYIAINFEQYLFMIDNTKIVPIKNKADLKKIFEKPKK